MYFNQKFYKKSFLLEFSNSLDINSIAFSLPPQSEDYTFSQRIGETKTYGGVVIEDYGNDLTKISLSGTTANSEVRIIYRGKKGTTFLNGEEEVFAIKKIIEEYGNQDKLGKEVYLYSLDTEYTSNNKYWRVVINDFQIKRSKDNPLAYTYTLNCTGLPEKKKRLDIFNWLEQFQKKVDEACEGIYSGLEFFETGLVYYRSGLELISVLKDTVYKFESALTSYVGALNEYSDTTQEYILETLSLGDEIIKSAERLTLGSGLNLFQAAADVSKAAKTFINYIRDFPEEDISTDLLELYSATASEIKNTWKIMATDIEDNANEIYASTELQCSTIDYSVIPGDLDVNDKVVTVYGYVQLIAHDGDTWDSLALSHYNNSNYGAIIALYNGSNLVDKIKVGTVISIPILSRQNSYDGSNLVYSNPDNRDNYGSDIYIYNNDIAVRNNDFIEISGQNNLNQAISSRLQTSLGSRIRVSLYGIRSTIGSISEADNYLLTSINQTVLNDPRVKSIDSLTYVGKGDNVQVDITYTDINNDSLNFGGLL